MPPLSSLRRRAGQFPEHPSCRSIKAVQQPVVGSKVDSSLGNSRSQPHRTIGIESPVQHPGFDIKCGQTAVDHRTDEKLLADRDRLVRRIEVQPWFVRPGWFGRRQHSRPMQVQCVRQCFSRDSVSLQTMPPHRPVGGDFATPVQHAEQREGDCEGSRDSHCSYLSINF